MIKPYVIVLGAVDKAVTNKLNEIRRIRHNLENIYWKQLNNLYKPVYMYFYTVYDRPDYLRNLSFCHKARYTYRKYEK